MENTKKNMSRGFGAGSDLVRMAAALALCAGLSGCVVVGASSRGGFFLWPGGLGLVLVIALFVLLMRRR